MTELNAHQSPKRRLSVRAVRRALALSLALAAALSSAQAQDIGDPWLESLRGATGTVIGDLTPRFSDGENADTPAGAGTGAGTAGATGPVDPAEQKTAGYIREWISVAEPPQNVTEGARFHYTYRGNMVGTTADGGIITSTHETGAFDPVFLWQNRRSLDSVDHCTMEEYVVAKLAEKPVDHCRGRYKPGSPVASGRDEAPAKGREQIDQAIAACRFDEAKALIDRLDNGTVRQSVQRRYDEAYRREEKTKDLFGKADAAYRNCDFDDAKASLTAAAKNTACERYRAKIAQAADKVAAAAAHEEKTKALFSEADRFFKQKNYTTARARLEAAKANTKCQRYVARIDQALGKVQGKIAQADAVAPPPVTPPVSPPPTPPVAAGQNYFVGIWALSKVACTGTAQVPQRQNKTPGSIAGAIEQGVEEAIDIVAATLNFKFGADGVVYVIKSGGQPVRFGTWSVKNDIFTTTVDADGDTESQRILERRSDRVILSSPRANKQMTLYRCSDADGISVPGPENTGPGASGTSATGSPATGAATTGAGGSGPDKIIGHWSIASVQGHRITGIRRYGVETVIDVKRVPGSNPPAYVGTLVYAGSKFETARPGEEIMRFEILPDVTASLKKPFYEVRGRALFTKKIGDWQKLGRAYLDFDRELDKEVITGSIVPWIRGEPGQ